MTPDSLIGKIVQGLKDMCYIWTKEIRSVFTDEGALIFLILVPLGYPLLYSWIYNNETVRDVPVAVVDMSHSQASREFIRHFDAGSDTRVAYYCDNIGEARDLVGKQAVHGVLYFPPEFSTRLGRGQQAHVGVYCDMSLMLTYKAIYQTAQAVASEMNSHIQIRQSADFTSRDDDVTTRPLDFAEVEVYNTTNGYGNAIIPGVLMLILQQTLLLGIGLMAGTARENNRYKDLVPVSRHYNGIFRIVMGKSMCYFMVHMVMGTWLALVVPRLFHFVSLVDAFTIFAFLVPYILACVFFGMMLSCLVRYRENVILLVVFTSVPLLFMTGISWPQSNIPRLWQSIAWLFPSTWGIRGFLRISSMGASISEIRAEYMALWIQVAAYFILTCAVYRFQLEYTRRHARRHMSRLKLLARKHMEDK